MKRFRKSAIALVLALLMALQGTEPIFVQAKEAIEDVQKNADFSRPEALTEEEAGITDSTSGEQDKSQQSDADVQNETTPSEDTETQEEQTTPAEETEENPQEKEVELKEPQDYYPIPEEPEGELIDYDAISKTYKTGDKQYTTVYGGYVGTYKNEDGDTELVDNTLVKPEEADTPASEEAQEASSVVATEEKEEKTEVYQNKANDYASRLDRENIYAIRRGEYAPLIVTKAVNWFADYVYALRNALFHEIISPLDEEWQGIFKSAYLLLKQVSDICISCISQIEGFSQTQENAIFEYAEKHKSEYFDSLAEYVELLDFPKMVLSDWKIEKGKIILKGWFSARLKLQQGDAKDIENGTGFIREEEKGFDFSATLGDDFKIAKDKETQKECVEIKLQGT